MKDVVLGVDIGGTKIAVGLVDADGRVHGEVDSYKYSARHEEELLTVLRTRIRRGLKSMAAVGTGAGRARAIGAACAGTVDRVAGVVIDSPNLPLSDTALKDFIEGEFGIPTVVENDVNAALWAESKLGAARGLKHVVMLTLGTGLGGARCWTVVSIGAPRVRLRRDRAHIVDPHGERCRCGVRGCLEDTWRRQDLNVSAFGRLGFSREARSPGS